MSQLLQLQRYSCSCSPTWLPRGNTQTITSTYRASSVVARVNFTVILMPSKQMLCDPPSDLCFTRALEMILD